MLVALTTIVSLCALTLAAPVRYDANGEVGDTVCTTTRVTNEIRPIDSLKFRAEGSDFHTPSICLRNPLPRRANYDTMQCPSGLVHTFVQPSETREYRAQLI